MHYSSIPDLLLILNSNFAVKSSISQEMVINIVGKVELSERVLVDEMV